MIDDILNNLAELPVENDGVIAMYPGYEVKKPRFQPLPTRRDGMTSSSSPGGSSRSWNTYRVQLVGKAVVLWVAGQSAAERYLTLNKANEAVQAAIGQQACFVQRFLPDILIRP